MLKFKRVVLGISGGVDSAVSALLLKNKGFDVQAVFMQNWDIADEQGICKGNEDYKDAEKVCQLLNIPICSVNFVKHYWNEVFSGLINDYETGFTPNPDIMCNREIKFKYFFEFAKDHMSADSIATGHYARTSFGPYLEYYQPDRDVKLFRAVDSRKDQTFFLSQVKQEALRRTMFPLGYMTKEEVRKIARDNKLGRFADKKESMGICFIGSRNFQNFISEYVTNKEGDFVDIDSGEVVGKHSGIHQWTLGQRTRIQGVKDAFFTVKKDVQKNIIYVAGGTDHPALFSELLFTSEPHWICSAPAEIKENNVLTCQFKFQHVESLIDCDVCRVAHGLIIRLKHKKRALTPGQFAVLYKNEECLGSARIVYAGPSDYFLCWSKYNAVKEATLGSCKEKIEKDCKNNLEDDFIEHRSYKIN